jgi:hypothetical protein
VDRAEALVVATAAVEAVAEAADSHSEVVEAAEGLVHGTAMVLESETSMETEAHLLVVVRTALLVAQVDPDTDVLAQELADHRLVDQEADTVPLVLAEAGPVGSVALDRALEAVLARRVVQVLDAQQAATGHRADQHNATTNTP